MKTLILILTSLLVSMASLTSGASEVCGYNEAPGFCSMEQYYKCEADSQKNGYEVILRLKTIGSNPYKLKHNGNALGLLRFEYDLWASFDDGFEYQASERHSKTGKRYENGAAQTMGPQVSYRLYASQFVKPIRRQGKHTNLIREGMVLEFQREDLVRGDYDTHYFLMHAVPEKNRFTMFWYAFDTPRESGEKGVLKRRVTQAKCKPVRVK